MAILPIWTGSHQWAEARAILKIKWLKLASLAVLVGIFVSLMQVTRWAPTADNCVHPSRRSTSAQQSDVSKIEFRSMLSRTRQHSECFVYDNAPRTVGHWVSDALRDCLQSRQFTILSPGISKLSPWDVIPNLLALPSDRVATTHFPFHLDDSLVRLLQTRCTYIHYVTATRPMSERLVKYGFWAVAKFAPNARDKLSQQTPWAYPELAVLSRVIRTISRQVEELFEWYPFTCAELSESDGNLVKPDFVIRSTHVVHDLSTVLSALHCIPLNFSGYIGDGGKDALELDDDLSDKFVTHDGSQSFSELVAPIRSQLIKQRIGLRYSDARHRRLLTFINKTTEGLA